MPDLKWTYKEYKQHKKEMTKLAETIYPTWPKMPQEDIQKVLDSYEHDWLHEYFGNIERLCHIQDSKGRYFTGYCPWLTLEELRANGYTGLTTCVDATEALMTILKGKAAGHPDFQESFESYQVVPILIESHTKSKETA